MSLSTEIGYQRAGLLARHLDLGDSADRRQGRGRWYFAVNPALERTLHGPDVNQGFGLLAGAKVSYDFTSVVSGGLEYYADYGEIGNIAPCTISSSRLFLVTDLNVSPKWEINFGVGIGPTAATDHWIIKGIVGRHFSWIKHPDIE